MRQIKIILSSSTLLLFLECPRCFWLQINKHIKRPSLPFPSLPAGMDKILKEHFDKHRAENTIPEELEGKFEGKLFMDMEKLKGWRSEREGLRFIDEETGITLMGAIDDLFVTKEGLHAPLDFKTRGYPKKDHTHEYYQQQMDIYSLLLEKNGLKPADFAILIFYHPVVVNERCQVEFNPDAVKVSVDRKCGEQIFRNAIKCLLGEEPQPSKECPFCNWNWNNSVRRWYF